MASYDYDVLVLGGGAAGLTASGIAVNLGAKTLLVERDRLGGDCTWTGCVPSKALIKSASVAHHARHADRWGLTGTELGVDFPAVMERVRRIRQKIYEDADAPDKMTDQGVETEHGMARFKDPHTVEIALPDGTVRTVSAKYVVLATGGRPMLPPIEGLDDVEVLTSETLFELTEQPERMVCLGAGPIGTEMAQAFGRLGTQVTVVDRAARILQHDDEPLARQLQEVLEEEGIRYVLEASVEKVTEDAVGLKRVYVEQDGEELVLEADALLVATGRQPNVEELHLEAAGVKVGEHGIATDRHGRTNQRHIYAVGDLAGPFQFTHWSEHTAKTAVMHALLKLPAKQDAEHLPWVTYTEPELAHVGVTQQQLDDDGTAYEVYRFPYEKLDRALCEGAPVGEVCVYATKLTGTILGASVLGERGGELIALLGLAMTQGTTLRQVADTLFPYPTYALGARRAADQWYVQKQSPTVTRLVQKIFGYRGPVLGHEPGRIV